MGVAWPGEARRGGVRRGVAGTLKQHLARQGRTRPGRARHSRDFDTNTTQPPQHSNRSAGG